MNTATTTTLSLADIKDLLDDVTFRPFAQAPWEFIAERRGPDLMLTLTQRFARDVSTFDPFEEYDDWTMLDGHTQSFERLVRWPDSPLQLRRWCAEIAAYALAHEALEWLWWGDEKLHDPHSVGDVAVSL